MTLIAFSVLVVVAELVLWANARRNRYGRTADGAFLAAAIGFAGMAFVPDEDVALWSLVLALAATFVLFVLAFNKGELK